MPKSYMKLVRDNIPEIIKRNNQVPHFSILNEDRYKFHLLKKLIEEAQEAMAEEKDMVKLSLEIGDLQEVIDAVIKAFDLNQDEILALRNARKEERGGFEKRIFLESVE